MQVIKHRDAFKDIRDLDFSIASQNEVAGYV